MSKELYKIAINLNNGPQPTEVLVRDDLDSVSLVFDRGKTKQFYFERPLFQFGINGKFKLAISPMHGNGLSEKENKERLLFAAPVIGERKLQELYDHNGSWDFAFNYHPIPLEQGKEKAAGETYRQRRHLCYDDLCN